MSATSSEEEDYEKFKDSVNHSMYIDKNCKTLAAKVPDRPSSGNKKENILNVTEEFKTHLAKKLFKKLESEIEYCDVNHAKQSNDVIQYESTGVRLFTNSDVVDDVQNDDYVSTKNMRKKKKKKDKKRAIDIVDDLKPADKIKSAAVSPEWVVERKGVQCWAERKNRVTKLKPVGNNKYEVIDE